MACALLARLRVPPKQWTLGLQAVHAAQLHELEGWMAELKQEAAPKGRGRRGGRCGQGSHGSAPGLEQL